MSEHTDTAQRTGTLHASRFVQSNANRVRPAMLASLAAAVCLLAVPAVASAAACPDEGAREGQVHGSALPDCRAYEQVSPVDTNDIDAKGLPGNVQASPSGDRIRYFSLTPFAGGESPGGGFRRM